MKNYIKKKIKIGFDISKMHSYHVSRGIGFYSQNLVEALKKYSKDEIIVIDQGVANLDLDIIHFPFFDLYNHTLPIFKSLPTIVTIHDITSLVFPEHYPPGINGKINFYLQNIALKDVSAIVTDSESSKKDIIQYLKIDRKKIHTVYLAPSSAFKPVKVQNLLDKIKMKYKLPDNFALYVGDVNWNKNLINLTQACLQTDLDLVLVGSGFLQKDALNHPELATFKEFIGKFSQNKKIHILGFVPTADLVIIYNLTQLLLLPSFYEGFGLPILEAQACGTPVITSNISSMPEVAGDGVLFVDPYQVTEIEKAIRSIWDDASLRLNLIKKGFDNVSQFSWKKTAQETVKVYYHVLR